MLTRLGMGEILVIMTLIGVVFYGKRLPELGETFGLTISNFKKAAIGEPLDDEQKA